MPKAAVQTKELNGKIMHSVSWKVQYKALSWTKSLGYFHFYGKLSFDLLCMLNYRLILLCGYLTNQIIFCFAFTVLVLLLSNSHDSFVPELRKLFTFRLFY